MFIVESCKERKKSGFSMNLQLLKYPICSKNSQLRKDFLTDKVFWNTKISLKYLMQSFDLNSLKLFLSVDSFYRAWNALKSCCCNDNQNQTTIFVTGTKCSFQTDLRLFVRSFVFIFFVRCKCLIYWTKKRHWRLKKDEILAESNYLRWKGIFYCNRSVRY